MHTGPCTEKAPREGVSLISAKGGGAPSVWSIGNWKSLTPKTTRLCDNLQNSMYSTFRWKF